MTSQAKSSTYLGGVRLNGGSEIFALGTPNFSIIDFLAACKAPTSYAGEKFENRIIDIRKSDDNRQSKNISQFQVGLPFASSATMPFLFDDLQVYQLSLEWGEQVEKLCKRSKDALTLSFKGQFQRASLSVLLNIAEGNGRWHSTEK